jgi:hypothetical protein
MPLMIFPSSVSVFAKLDYVIAFSRQLVSIDRMEELTAVAFVIENEGLGYEVELLSVEFPFDCHVVKRLDVVLKIKVAF